MYIFLLMDNYILKKMVLQWVLIRPCHSWYFYDWIGQTFITNVILFYGKLPALRGRHYCLRKNSWYSPWFIYSKLVPWEHFILLTSKKLMEKSPSFTSWSSAMVAGRSDVLTFSEKNKILFFYQFGVSK